MRSISASLIGCLLMGCSLSSSDERAKHAASETPHTLWMGGTRLRAIPGELGNGFAEIRFLSNEEMHLTLRANLVPMAAGYYEAWMGTETSAKSIGRLTVLEGGGGMYSLAHQEKIAVLQLPPDPQNIFVTWEEEDDDPRPNVRVLEGTFIVANAGE